MEYHRQDNGLLAFLEHWGFLVGALSVFVFTKVLDFFFNLNGELWIYLFAASMGLLITGAGLIFFAKIPVYRSGRFLTFGLKSIPRRLVVFYKWGWRIFLFGAVLSLLLLLSR